MEVGADSGPPPQRLLGDPHSRCFDSSRTTTGHIGVTGKRKGSHQASTEATAGVGTPDVGIPDQIKATSTAVGQLADRLASVLVTGR